MVAKLFDACCIGQRACADLSRVDEGFGGRWGHLDRRSQPLGAGLGDASSGHAFVSSWAELRTWTLEFHRRNGGGGTYPFRRRRVDLRSRYPRVRSRWPLRLLGVCRGTSVFVYWRPLQPPTGKYERYCPHGIDCHGGAGGVAVVVRPPPRTSAFSLASSYAMSTRP